MIDALGFKDRVKLTGFLPHQRVMDYLIQAKYI